MLTSFCLLVIATNDNHYSCYACINGVIYARKSFLGILLKLFGEKDKLLKKNNYALIVFDMKIGLNASGS